MANLPPLTLVLGGAASGKSGFAERLIVSRNSDAQRVYVATAQPFDDEMRAKIDRHQKMRASDGWITHEDPIEVACRLNMATRDQIILLDCATLWLTNQVMARAELTQEFSKLTRALRDCAATVVVVTNEVGQGIVPEHAMSRHFREAQGRLNQQLAAEAQLVVQVIAGLPQLLKGNMPDGVS